MPGRAAIGPARRNPNGPQALPEEFDHGAIEQKRQHEDHNGRGRSQVRVPATDEKNRGRDHAGRGASRRRCTRSADRDVGDHFAQVGYTRMTTTGAEAQRIHLPPASQAA